MPALAKTYDVKPEQSKPEVVVPPHKYGVPNTLFAVDCNADHEVPPVEGAGAGVGAGVGAGFGLDTGLLGAGVVAAVLFELELFELDEFELVVFELAVVAGLLFVDAG